jgi:hypothetical protein
MDSNLPMQVHNFSFNAISLLPMPSPAHDANAIGEAVSNQKISRPALA